VLRPAGCATLRSDGREAGASLPEGEAAFSPTVFSLHMERLNSKIRATLYLIILA